MDIREWHELLDRHFSDLWEKRRGKEEWPVFGLEHGLDEVEVADIKRAICDHLKSDTPVRKYWLPWIVYGAEIGYEYDGQEYWQTFEEKTPGWLDFGDRDFIRDKYKEFWRKYGGAKPSGVWADHFSIISWPITHAILPKDLQRQLAKILYDLRSTFSAALLQSPAQLGKKIAENSYEGTTRFQQFAQDEILMGQIARALLAHEDEQKLGHTLLLPKTLSRIVKDIGSERMARDWLRDARNKAHAVNLRGLTRDETRQQTGNKMPQPQAGKLGIEPRVVLRPMSSDVWEVFLEVPDLAPLLNRFPNLHDIFSNSRCNILGAERPLARGRLVNDGTQRISLKKWPSNGELLLQFEGPRPENLDFLLGSECSLRPGPLWLCRIAADGMAYEVRSLTVRPGNKYIVINTTGPIPKYEFCSSVKFSCAGIYGARLEVPTALSTEGHYFLDTIGLTLARSINVWPAGLCAKTWNGEGDVEWLSVDTPCIGVRVDYPVDSLFLTIDDNDSENIELESPKAGANFYISLSSLSLGPHRLNAFAKSGSADQFKYLGQLNIIIKEPRPLQLKPIKRNAINLTMDPLPLFLEELRNGDFSLEIQGCSGQRISTSLYFLRKGSEKHFLKKVMHPINLPINPEEWKTSFIKWIQDQEIQDAFATASHCRIEITGGEEEPQFYICERATMGPLTWVFEQARHEPKVCLINELESDPVEGVIRYDFLTPDSPVEISSIAEEHKYLVNKAGGMYVARTRSDVRCGIIVAREIGRIDSLQDIKPQLKHRDRSSQCLEDLCELIELWLSSNPYSAFARWEQEHVLRALQSELFGLIGGWRWKCAEQDFLDRPHPSRLRSLASAVTTHKGGKRLEQVLLDHSKSFKNAELDNHVEFLTVLLKNSLGPIPQVAAQGKQVTITRGYNWYVKFALRLAGTPQRLKTWSGPWWQSGLNYLLNNALLARAARFIVLACDDRLCKLDIESQVLTDGV